MKAFIVIQMGVYRHDIWGIRYSLEAAKALGEEKLKLERDDYHVGEIVALPMDEERDDHEAVVGAMVRTDKKEGGKIISSEIVWKPSRS